jgi:xanthine dehydrogenase accessory factor
MKPSSLPRLSSRPSLLEDEDVLSPMLRWQSEGQRVALITLVGVDGGAPRQPGSQMAVAADGRHAGYLSGGCLEQAVVLEAQAVMAERQNRLVRYGRGSPYFDIQLPCGSGLDLYFDQALGQDLLTEMVSLRTERRPFALRTMLSSGSSSVARINPTEVVQSSFRADDLFSRVYPPNLRLLLLGSGPALVGMAILAVAAGIELTVLSDDETTRAEIAAACGLERCLLHDDRLTDAIDQIDFASAAVLYFHSHEKEPDLLALLLLTKSYYIGALGNHAVHRERLATLAERGIAQSDLSRIRAPVGSIAGAKSKATLAVGVLAEMMTEAKGRNLIS